MRPLDWRSVLSEHRVPFVERGANVSRGEINIKCPFCGSADPSYHMGLNLDTGWWSCWRNRQQHSGKSPLRLLMKLLGVSYGRAREIAGLGDGYIDPEGFDALAAQLMRSGGIDGRPEEIQRRVLHLDPAFIPITDRIATRKHWNYLYGRGFDGESRLGPDVDVLVKDYQLCACLDRRYKGQHWEDRIILPYYQDGELMTWTARAIAPARVRYQDLMLSESVCGPKETLYNHDAMLEGGKALVIVEGPFDALKVDFYGKPWGVRAVALSTNSMSETQGYLIGSARQRFKRCLLMMDTAISLDIIADGLRVAGETAGLFHLEVIATPYGAKDAGELRPKQIISWAQAL